MSDPARMHDLSAVADALALAVQRLRHAGRLDSDQPLLRVDPRVEAATAPFQFDSVNAVLHRRGCAEIPAGARSAVYAVWRISRKDLGAACGKCRPMPRDNQPEQPSDVTDLVLGVLSLVDQFGSILSQRGRDFRRTERGRRLERSLSSLLGDVSKTRKQGAQFLSSAMDRLLATLDRARAETQGARGKPRHNGKPRRKPPATPSRVRKSAPPPRS